MSKRTTRPSSPTTKSHWDAISTDGQLKARAKKFTVRDGLLHAQIERRLTDHYLKLDIQGDVDKETEMLFIIQNYPLLVAGIEEAEGFELPMTEEVFWSLHEDFMNILTERIRAKNPQYALPFSELKKLIFQSFQNTDEVMQESILPSAQTAKSG